MEISTADVVKLRKATGAGMMDCKNALADAEGNFDRAVEIIREKGKLVASKRADRESSEGVVLAKVSADQSFGAVISLNCETDFVAKNDNFIALTHKIADEALANKSKSLDEVKALMLDGRTIGEQVMEQTGIIGEKIELPFYESISATFVVPYIHPGNKLATLVGFNKVVDVQVGKDIAMQIAAMSPVAIDNNDVAPEIVEQELKIAKEKFRLEGKPENMLDKIAQGALNKFFKESTLLNQDFVKDNKMTIRQYLGSIDKDLKVTEIKRFTLNV
ncbi:MAG TPA: translation elongation factor Ts [Prolixibacteraceae bacterium]|nr:translation elongation factor Ts [Prolixibacteraceae bacterium]